MSAEARRDVFQAIADPTRREIIDLIVKKGPMNLNAIAEKFTVSRPAISQHIKILAECGIVTFEQTGRERYCKIQPASFIPAFLWMEHHQQQWTDKIDSFEKYVTKLQTKKRKK